MPLGNADPPTLVAIGVEVLEGAGHLPWLDDPARMAAEISRFVTAPQPA